MKHNILYISSWYPTRLKPTLGNFIYKHAESAIGNQNIRAIHVCLDSNLSQKSECEYSKKPFPSKVIYLKKNSIPLLGRLIDYLRMINTYIKEYKLLIDEGFTPDLVHANIVYPIGIIAWLYKRKFGVNYIISEHWTGYHDYADPRAGFFKLCVLRFLANRALAILPDSEDLGRAIQRHGIKTKIIPVANVVNTKFFTPAIEKSSRTVTKMVHISTLDEKHKNFNLLLEAFAQVADQEPNLELHVINDGEMNDYASKIKELNIESKIINHGKLDTEELAETLKQCDFFVLTSNFENLPCVLIESISCGVPVIATNVGGVSEIVNLQNGIIVEPRNIKELVKAMFEMMDKHNVYDKNLLHEMAVEKYSYEAISHQFTDIYKLIIEPKSQTTE